MRTTLHLFMPGQTIDAAIKFHAHRNLTPAEIGTLRVAFNEVNGTPIVRPGMSLKIPVLDQLSFPGEERVQVVPSAEQEHDRQHWEVQK